MTKVRSLFEKRLRENGYLYFKYLNSPEFHAEAHVFVHALEVVYLALVADEQKNVDEIIGVLVNGFLNGRPS